MYIWLNEKVNELEQNLVSFFKTTSVMSVLQPRDTEAHLDQISMIEPRIGIGHWYVCLPLYGKISLFTTLTNLRTNYLMMWKVYTIVGGMK